MELSFSILLLQMSLRVNHLTIPRDDFQFPRKSLSEFLTSDFCDVR